MPKYYKFFDLSGGGFQKTDYRSVFVEANSEEEASKRFIDKFEVDPYAWSCNCCGPDFAIDELEPNELHEYVENNDSFLVIQL